MNQYISLDNNNDPVILNNHPYHHTPGVGVNNANIPPNTKHPPNTNPKTNAEKIKTQIMTINIKTTT